MNVFIQYINVTKKFILKGLITTAENDILLYFVLIFFRDNTTWHFMWIVCPADN